MPCNRNLMVKRYLQRRCRLCIVMHILNRSFMRSSPVFSVTLLPGQGQAQPVPYMCGGCPSYRVRAGLAPALESPLLEENRDMQRTPPTYTSHRYVALLVPFAFISKHPEIGVGGEQGTSSVTGESISLPLPVMPVF